MQVYRGMDIGTAKPESAELERLPHELIDIRDPDEQYSAGDFVRDADEAMARIHAAGKLAVVSGGTAFYLKNFIYGCPGAPPSDAGTRAAVKGDLERLGPEALMRELAEADPVSASRIHLNDRYRLTRAVEVVRRSGRALSEFRAGTDPRPGYRFLLVGLERPRDELYARIDARVEAMFSAGLPAEVAALRAAGYGFGDPGMRAIGYREFAALEALDGDGSGPRPGIGPEDILLAIKEQIKMNSRRYAKRQLAFMRALPNVEWFSPERPDLIAERISSWLQEGSGFEAG
jgi:tRNA dimethylallyltransferase